MAFLLNIHRMGVVEKFLGSLAFARSARHEAPS
jgi:hypothetical protein